MHSSLCRRLILFLLILALVACTSPTLTATIPSTSTVTTPASVNGNQSHRYGTIQIEAVQASGVSGTFTAKENDDGSTSLSIQLDVAADFNPWGIYNNTGDCMQGVPENTRTIFSMPDIENGSKEETVETDVYKSTPGNLILIVYGISPDGSQQMIACANLGEPLLDENTLPTTQVTDCPSPYIPSSELDSDTWLAFSATKNSNSDIYILNVDSVLQGNDSSIQRLTTHPAADFDPTWSPDGTRIAFRSQRDGNDDIYVMNADGTCQTNLTNDPLGDWSPAWSPDGKQITFAHFFGDNSFTDIALINVDGSGLTRLTNGHGEYPTWLPDGTQIAFATARDGNYEIYVMNADGTKQTRLTDNPAYDMSPVWSPNGTQIAFDTQRDHYPPVETGIGPEFEIHAINMDGSKDMKLTTNEDREDRFPDWGANGLIAFTSNGSLFIMNSDGTNLIKLLDGGSFPAWRPIIAQ